MSQDPSWDDLPDAPSGQSQNLNWDDLPDAKPEESLGQQLGSALKRGAADLGVGASELVHNIINAPHNLLWNAFPKQDEINYQAAFGAPQAQDKNLADKVIQVAPDLAASIALPEAGLGEAGSALLKYAPYWGKYLKTALGNGLSQGLFAATQSPENPGESGLIAGGIAAPFSGLAQAAIEGSPLTRGISKALLGVGAGGLGYAGAKAAGQGNLTSALIGAGAGILGASHGINPTRMAKENALKGVDGTDYQAALDAADRLGLKYITPAEASNNPFTGAEQGSIGKTAQGAQMLYKAGQERADTEKGSINSLFDTIFNKSELPQVRDKLYETAKPQLIPDDKLAPLQDNEIFKAALSKVQNNPAYVEKLKNVPQNSIEYLDMVKRAMGDMIQKSKNKGNLTESSLVKSTQNDLVSTMDDTVPEYQAARAIAERGIVRRNLEKVFNKQPMTGSNFGKFLNNDEKYSQLQNNLRNVPEAQDKLDDMKMIFQRLINIPTAKSAAALSGNSMSKDRASSATALRMLKEILSGGSYDKTAVELITNPKWSDEITKLKGISNTDKFLGNTYNLLGKAGAQTIGQDNQE